MAAGACALPVTAQIGTPKQPDWATMLFILPAPLPQLNNPFWWHLEYGKMCSCEMPLRSSVNLPGSWDSLGGTRGANRHIFLGSPSEPGPPHASATRHTPGPSPPEPPHPPPDPGLKPLWASRYDRFDSPRTPGIRPSGAARHSPHQAETIGTTGGSWGGVLLCQMSAPFLRKTLKSVILPRAGLGGGRILLPTPMGAPPLTALPPLQSLTFGCLHTVRHISISWSPLGCPTLS